MRYLIALAVFLPTAALACDNDRYPCPAQVETVIRVSPPQYRPATHHWVKHVERQKAVRFTKDYSKVKTVADARAPLKLHEAPKEIPFLSHGNLMQVATDYPLNMVTLAAIEDEDEKPIVIDVPQPKPHKVSVAIAGFASDAAFAIFFGSIALTLFGIILYLTNPWSSIYAKLRRAALDYRRSRNLAREKQSRLEVMSRDRREQFFAQLGASQAPGMDGRTRFGRLDRPLDDDRKGSTPLGSLARQLRETPDHGAPKWWKAGRDTGRGASESRSA